MVFFLMKGKQFKKFPLNVMSRLTSTSFIFSLMIIILFKIFRLELLKFFELARDLPVKYNTISCAVNFELSNRDVSTICTFLSSDSLQFARGCLYYVTI